MGLAGIQCPATQGSQEQIEGIWLPLEWPAQMLATPVRCSLFACRRRPALLTEDQLCLSNRPTQARRWPECHRARSPAAQPQANDLTATAVPGQRQTAGNDKAWQPCRWLIS